MKRVDRLLPNVWRDLGLEDVHQMDPPNESQTRQSRRYGNGNSRAVGQFLGNFAPVPYKLIDLGYDLAQFSTLRGFARVFQLVVLDLVRFTDWGYLDVIVTNGGISGRTRVSKSGVKAVIAELLKMEVLRKTRPSPARLRQLRMNVPGGFGPGRRYLVWNPHIEWGFPLLSSGIRDIEKTWENHRGKRKEVKDTIS